MAISTEGKIAIGLALLFPLGAGGVMVAPEQQLWIGWATIAVAAGGLILLGIYHISTAVAPINPTPKPVVSRVFRTFGLG